MLKTHKVILKCWGTYLRKNNNKWSISYIFKKKPFLFTKNIEPSLRGGKGKNFITVVHILAFWTANVMHQDNILFWYLPLRGITSFDVEGIVLGFPGQCLLNCGLGPIMSYLGFSHVLFRLPSYASWNFCTLPFKPLICQIDFCAVWDKELVVHSIPCGYQFPRPHAQTILFFAHWTVVPPVMNQGSCFVPEPLCVIPLVILFILVTLSPVFITVGPWLRMVYDCLTLRCY